MLTELYPFLLPERVGDDLPGKLRALAEDLDRVRKSHAPGEDRLVGTPLIRSWRIVVDPTGLRLVGYVSGHPRTRDGLAMTTQLWAADSDGRWIRTLSRFYRLGEPAGIEDSGEDGNEDCEVKYDDELDEDHDV